MIDLEHGPRVVVLTLEGPELVRRFGGLHHPRHSDWKRYPTPAQADAGLGLALHRLRAAGYVFAGEREDMLAAIEREPDEVAHYRVYADWLIIQGNPHGELIQLMISASERPDDLALGAAIDRLRHRHRHRFEGKSWRALPTVWRWGFVVEADLSGVVWVAPDEIGDHRVLRDQVGLRGRILGIHRHPCARALRRIRVWGRLYKLTFDGGTVATTRVPTAGS